MGTSWLGPATGLPSSSQHVCPFGSGFVFSSCGQRLQPVHPQLGSTVPHPHRDGLTWVFSWEPTLSRAPIAGKACRAASLPFLHRVTRQIPSFLARSSSSGPFLFTPRCSVRWCPRWDEFMKRCRTQSQLSSSTIAKQCSSLKLIQGPYLLVGKKGSKYGVRFGGAVKEMQAMIKQYHNIISVSMKLKSAISLSPAVKNLYLKGNKVYE